MQVVKKVKYTSPFITLLISILLIGGGIFLLLTESGVTASIMVIGLCIGLLIYGIREFARLNEEQESKQAIGALLLYVLLALALLIFAKLFVGILNIVFALVAFALFGLRVLIGIHMVKNGISGFIRNAISGLICLFFSLALLLYPAGDKIYFTMFVTGIYLICMGVTIFGDFLAGVFGSDMDPERTDRRVHFAMPNAVTATTTKRLINLCNEHLEKNPEDTCYIEEKEGTKQSDINFEVLIHASRKKGKSFGHVDIAIGDTVYTYGCYDSRTCRMAGFVAGGTFVIMPKNPYVNLCLTEQEKYIIAYGCVLSEKQMNEVKERIEEIMLDTEQITDIDLTKKDSRGADGVTSYVGIGGKAYRVIRGPFKTYFAIASNCVKLADTIAGKAGLDSITKGNLVTPGSYLCMMENMFYRKNTRVIRRKVYLQAEKQ